MTQRDQLISWLNDAHAMESQLLPILRSHAKEANDLPQAKQRSERHIQETEGHASRMEKAVQSLGSSTSSVKSGAGTLFGAAQGMTSGMTSDTAVKNAVSDFAAEEFEVATYKALVIAAERVGEPEVARLCRENLREDEAMAEWLQDHLETVVRHTLNQAA